MVPTNSPRSATMNLAMIPTTFPNCLLVMVVYSVASIASHPQLGVTGLGNPQITLMSKIVPSALRTLLGAVLGISVCQGLICAMVKKIVAMAVTRETADKQEW